MTPEIIYKLREGIPSIGSWMQLPSSDVAEIMGKSGYDWVAVDLEHGGFSRKKLPDRFRALELGGTAPLARVAQCNPKDIKVALDAGACGIILPMIESGEQLENGIAWAHYPPRGNRGVGYSRANLFGRQFDSYRKANSKSTLIIAQIEHINAVDNLDAILSVDGLHAIMVGPYDLSGSMGITADFNNPDFHQVLIVISQKAKSSNVPMGLHIVQPDREELVSRIEQGYQFIAYGTDAVFLYSGSQCPNYKIQP